MMNRLLCILTACAACWLVACSAASEARVACRATADVPAPQESSLAGHAEPVELSEHAVEWADPPWSGWLVNDPEGGANYEYALQRVGPLHPADGNVRYTLCYSFTGEDTEFNGSVWFGVADFGAGRWSWFDCTQLGWCPLCPDHQVAGMPLDAVDGPVSPDGWLYYAFIACEEPSSGVVADMLRVDYEFTEPFLDPPALEAAYLGGGGITVEIDHGEDWELLNCGTLQLSRCHAGEFDVADSIIVWNWDRRDFWPGEYVDKEIVIDGSYTYCARLLTANTGAVGSAWSNTLTVELP